MPIGIFLLNPLGYLGISAPPLSHRWEPISLEKKKMILVSYFACEIVEVIDE